MLYPRAFSVVFSVIATAASGAGAVTFYVNTAEDLPDVNVGDGIALAANGKTTFRAAVEESNFRMGPDTILFMPYAVDDIGEEALYLDDTISITGDLTVDSTATPGNGFGVQCRLHGSEPFRAFDVGSNVRLNMLFPSEFQDDFGFMLADRGAFMYIRPEANVQIAGVVFGGTASIAGGGVYVDHASLQLSQDVVGDSDGDGGAIYNDHGTILSGGGADGTAQRGGAIFNNGGTVYSVALGGDTAQLGGDVYSDGGSIFIDTRVSRGSDANNGASFYLANNAVVQLVRSAIYSGASSGDGGAIYVESGTLLLSNCTFAGCSAGSSGGALYMANGDATILNCTFVENVAATGGSGSGGAIAIVGSAVCRIGNTVIAKNTTSPGGVGQDVVGSIQSLGHNAIGVADGASGFVPSDRLGSLISPLDPLLGKTIRSVYFLQPGSLLIDAGDNTLLSHPNFAGSLCSDGNWDSAGNFDPRVRGAGVDIGAIEFQVGTIDNSACASDYSADYDHDRSIGLNELLRVVQLYNSAGFHCASSATDDGFDIGPGDESCMTHSADYSPTDWRISLTELLRVVQLYNSPGYHACVGGEDGFCSGL